MVMIGALCVIVLFYVGMAYYIWFLDDRLYRSQKYWKWKSKIRKKLGRNRKPKTYANIDGLFL